MKSQLNEIHFSKALYLSFMFHKILFFPWRNLKLYDSNEFTVLFFSVVVLFVNAQNLQLPVAMLLIWRHNS